VCRRLRLPNDQTDEVVELVRDHLRFIPVRDMRESTLKRFLRRPNIEHHLELHRLDCLASHGDLSNYDFAREKLREYSREAMKPRLLLNGRDLEEAGLTPGPLFKEILNALEDEQLEGRISTREEALGWLRSKYVGTPDMPD
jgi:poly(A) polymerase